MLTQGLSPVSSAPAGEGAMLVHLGQTTPMAIPSFVADLPRDNDPETEQNPTRYWMPIQEVMLRLQEPRVARFR